MSDILETAGWILGIISILLLLLSFIPGGWLLMRGMRREAEFNAVRKPSTEEKTAFRLMLIFGSAWVIGNLGGNATGWYVIIDMIERWNGAATMPWWAVTLFLLIASILPNAGQWYVLEFGAKNQTEKLGANALIATDLAANAIGFYIVTQIPLWPLNLVVLAGCAIFAWIPNVYAQRILHTSHRKWRELRIKRLARIATARKKAGASPTPLPAPKTKPLSPRRAPKTKPL